MSAQLVADSSAMLLQTRFMPRRLYDADAAAGIAAVLAAGGSLTGAQQTACNTFIVGLKANSLWTGFYGLYLFVGGTSGAHAVNWKTPGTYDVTWVNSPTHNSGGTTGNGTTSYGYTTGLSGTQVPYQCGLSVYNRTTVSSSSGTQKRLIGNANGTSTIIHFIEYVDNVGIERNRGVLGGVATLAEDGASGVAQKTGLLSINRTTSTDFKGYHNGTQYLTNSTLNTDAPHTVPFAILALNLNGSYSNQAAETLGLAAVHAAHSSGSAATFNTLVQALQTAFGRNV